MFSKTTTSKFETQVHLGLLVIIFVLISLNFISNYITFNARVTEQRATAGSLQSAALAITRTLEQSLPNLSESIVAECKRQYSLSGLMVIPSQPENSSQAARRKWFLELVERLPTLPVPEVGRKILGAEYQALTRGENDEYFYVCPVPAHGGKYLLILSVNSPDLAYLDDSGNTVLAITVVSTILIMFTYYLLARYIFTPFRKLRRQAVESGRVVMGAENEALAVAEDYRRAIAELTDKEQKLIELNKQITRRADSLQQFNNYLLQSTNSGIVTFDLGGRILSINDSASELLGVNRVDYVGGLGSKLFLKESEIGKALETVMESRQNRPYQETEVSFGKGKKKIIGFSVSTVANEQEQPIGASIILSDLNEILNLRQELAGKNRLAALGEMSGGLAHQLRNSMGTIVGYCNLLKKEVNQKNISGDYFDELFSEVKETESLVKRFLSFARPLEYQPESVNLRGLVQETVAFYRPAAESGNYLLRLSQQDGGRNETIMYPVDALLLKQALNNIFDNAVDACENKKGEITAAIVTTAAAVIISVSDNGHGIPEDELDKVFTPFFSSKPSGTGLGLPLAAKIIDLHGGHITVESKVGRGTTFRIHLPVRVTSEPAAAVR